MIATLKRHSLIQNILRKFWPHALLAIILILNSLHNSYPDEFDNIFGGWQIIHGHLPYRDSFSHHGPMAYFLASPIVAIVGQSFVKFRIFSAFFFFMVFMIIRKFLANNSPQSQQDYTWPFIFFLGFSATYFWGHMFLADPISAYFIIISYSILFLNIFQNSHLTKSKIVAISFFSFLGFMTSMTYSYVIGILGVFTLFQYFNGSRLKLFSRQGLSEAIKILSIFGLPYLGFFIYLLITGSLKDFYDQAIIYNKNYYIYNYPRPEGSTTFNPIRYAVIILRNFLDNYQPLLTGVQHISFASPYNITLAFTNLALWIFLFTKKQFKLLLLSLLIIIYSTVRSNPNTSQATDYQSSVYFVLSFFHAFWLISVLSKNQYWPEEYAKKGILSVLSIILLIFWIFTSMALFGDFFRLNYDRYMGKMPLIYDRPEVAPVINSLVSKDQYCWIGPFQFEELYYLNCKLPSKYDWILPHFTKSPEIMNRVISDYSTNKAVIIAYQRNFSAIGGSADYNRFFIKLLDENYVRLKDLPKYKKYHFANNRLKDFDLMEDINFEKSKAEELINKLISNGYLINK